MFEVGTKGWGREEYGEFLFPGRCSSEYRVQPQPLSSGVMAVSTVVHFKVGQDFILGVTQNFLGGEHFRPQGLHNF